MSNQAKKKLNSALFSTLFSLPSVLLYTLFMIVPLIGVVYYSMTNWSGAGQPEFIGLDNFKYLLGNGDFWLIMKNTGILIILHLLIQIPAAVLLAFVLLRTKQGFRFFRGVYFLPTVVSATVIGLMFSLILNADVGSLNAILRSMNLGALAKNWLSDPKIVVYAVSLTIVWQYIGYYMSIILAGMQSLSEEMLESAVIDGANQFQLCTRIILPQIKGVLQVSILFTVTGCLKAFEHSFIMTWGGPGVSSTFLAVHMYKLAYFNSELGKGCAVAVIIVICALILTKISNLVFDDKDERVRKRR